MAQYIRALEERVQALQAEERNLADSGRKDESNLVKIRLNILNVCKTIYQVAQRTEKGEHVSNFYLRKLDELRKSWQEAGEKAEKYGKADAAMIESIKLETLQEAFKLYEGQSR